jgi:hypothetical protein
MKKILTIIAILSLLNLCKPVLKDKILYGSESNDNLTLDIREINYIKDNKMNLCFAYITQRSYGFYYNISFTEVNCKSIDFELLKEVE